MTEQSRSAYCAMGVCIECLVEIHGLRQRLPHVAPHCTGGMLCEGDGYAIPYKTTLSFKLAAEKHGATFLEGETALDIRHIGGVWLVTTTNRTYESRYLVNCAGAWADKIAIKIGDNAPMSYSAPMLMITTRMPAFATPVVGAVSRPLSFKQFENGTVLIGGGAKGFADRDNNRTRLDYSKLAAGASTATRFFPIMRTASVNRMWAVLEAYMPDNLPVIGPRLHVLTCIAILLGG